MKTFTRDCTLAFLLKVVAVSAILSGISFYLPEHWIDSFLGQCGLPEIPHAAMMRYVLLGAGHLQIGIGVVVWVIARDVVRYRPVVLAVLAVFLMAAPAFYVTDFVAGCPWYWCLLDFGCCFLAGGVPLLFFFGQPRPFFRARQLASAGVNRS